MIHSLAILSTELLLNGEIYATSRSGSRDGFGWVWMTSSWPNAIKPLG